MTDQDRLILGEVAAEVRQLRVDLAPLLADASAQRLAAHEHPATPVLRLVARAGNGILDGLGAMARWVAVSPKWRIALLLLACAGPFVGIRAYADVRAETIDHGAAQILGALADLIHAATPTTGASGATTIPASEPPT